MIPNLPNMPNPDISDLPNLTVMVQAVSTKLFLIFLLENSKVLEFWISDNSVGCKNCEITANQLKAERDLMFRQHRDSLLNQNK